MAKVQFHWESNTDIHSRQSSGIIDTVEEWGMREGEWEGMSEGEKDQVAEAWANDYIEIWWEEENNG